MQASALTATVGRQTIESMVGRATQNKGSGRNFTAHEARTSSSSNSVGVAGALASGAAAPSRGSGAGQELKFMRFSLSFDVKSAELFILVRDPASGKIVFKAPNIARPSPIDEVADKQEAELKAVMAGEGKKDSPAAAADTATVLAAAASNSNAPAEASATSSSRSAAGGGEASARGQGVNVTA